MRKAFWKINIHQYIYYIILELLLPCAGDDGGGMSAILENAIGEVASGVSCLIWGSMLQCNCYNLDRYDSDFVQNVSKNIK